MQVVLNFFTHPEEEAGRVSAARSWRRHRLRGPTVGVRHRNPARGVPPRADLTGAHVPRIPKPPKASKHSEDQTPPDTDNNANDQPDSSAEAQSATPTPVSGDPIEADVQHVEERAPEVNTDAVKHDEQEAERKRKEAAQKAKKGKRQSVVSRTTSTEEKAQKEAEFRALCRRSGEETVDALVLSCRTFFGPEWWYDPPAVIEMPDGTKILNDEQANLRRVYADTFEHYGWHATPSWMSIVVATGAYIGVRMNRPETQKKVMGIKERLARWWASWKVRHSEKKPATPPHQAPPIIPMTSGGAS